MEVLKMRIITPYGKVREFAKVDLCIEMLFDFNGRKVLKTEKAINGVVPNAILVSGNGESIRGGIFEPCNYSENFIIGNLTPEAVKAITSQLCEKGFYDFSSLEYQDYKNISELVIDGGKSLPYVNCNTYSYANNSFNNEMCPIMVPFDDRICARTYNDIDSADETDMSLDDDDMDTEGDEE